MPIQLSVVGMALAALLTAAVVSLIATPVVKSLAFRVGAVDIPKDGRRMHDHRSPVWVDWPSFLASCSASSYLSR